MATLSELYSLWSNSDLRNKVEVAVVIAAEAIRNEEAGTANHANRLVWAKAAFSNPQAAATACLKALIAANSGVPLASITGATDQTIKDAVLAVVDVFADGV